MTNRRCRLAACLLACHALLSCASAAVEPQAAPGTTLSFELTRGLLSLDARDAALGSVMRAIGEQAGFEAVIAAPMDRRITDNFHRLPLSRALARLLDGVDHVMIYAPGHEGEATPAVAEIWLLGLSPQAREASPGEAAPDAAETVAHPDLRARERADALLRLARKGATQETLDTVEDALGHDEAPLVRVRAAMVLGRLGDPRALPALELALDDEHRSVRMQAVQSISQIGGMAATLALGDVLLHGDDTQQRVIAAWGLWRQDDAQARRLLAEAANDADPQVRRAATRVPRAARDGAPGRAPGGSSLEAFESTR